MDEDVPEIVKICKDAYTKETPSDELDAQLKKVPDESKVRWQFRFEWPEEHTKGNPVTDHQVRTVIAEAYPPDADVDELATGTANLFSTHSICEGSESTAEPEGSSYQDPYGSTYVGSTQPVSTPDRSTTG
jgi:hypothetical protein